MAGAARAAAARVRNWRPAPPDALERALRSVARWPKVLLPFLVQSIGWFIGGFLFLAGSVFLVAYTSGFWQAAVVVASLYAYTVFLIWAGYKLLKTRPRLTTASFVLLATGMLLVPLIDSVPLPSGYYAPYLMIVCGLLFYLDAQFKLHVHRAAFLSHFSFLVYGLSVVAVVLAIDAPVARLITLALAAALYAMVLWKYLTLVPLYLMLASGCGLYADALLMLSRRGLTCCLLCPVSTVSAS